jgi:hypothetical protein
MTRAALATLLFSSIAVAASKAAPLAALPKGIEAPEAKLSLIADYGDVRDGRVALYLVNRTGRKVEFEAQDGALYIKLEAKEKDGSWARAQGHRFSWCGNSYFQRPALADGEFFALRGLFPKEGEEREVRYRLYGNDVVSNVGKGRVDPAEIRACRGDSFAARFGDFETVAAIVEKKVATIKRDHLDVRAYAVARMGRFKHARCAAVLTRLLADEDATIRKNAACVLGTLGDLAEPARPTLEKLARSDPDAEVRAAAEEALAKKP